VFPNPIGKLLDNDRIDEMRTGCEKSTARGIVVEASEDCDVLGR